MVDATKLSSADAAACYLLMVKASNNLSSALSQASRTDDDQWAVAAIRGQLENVETLKADWRARYPEILEPVPLPPAA